jgi:hypothetical protein
MATAVKIGEAIHSAPILTVADECDSTYRERTESRVKISTCRKSTIRVFRFFRNTGKEECNNQYQRCFFDKVGNCFQCRM